MSSANIYNENMFGGGAGSSATPTSSPWSTVLTNGNLTGAVNPTITAGQSIIFQSGIRIGGNNGNTAAVDTNGIALGSGATANTSNSISIGPASSVVTGTPGVSLGSQATCSGTGACVAVGQLAAASGTASTAIGSNAAAPGANGVRVGSTGAGANGSAAIAIGFTTAANGTDAVCVGSNTVAVAGAVRVGNNGAGAATVNSVAIGNGAICSTLGQNQIAIGLNTVASELRAVAVGPENSNAGLSATLVGSQSTIGAGCTDSILIGRSSTVTPGFTGVTVIGNIITGNQNGGTFIRMRSVAAGVGVTYNVATQELLSVPSASRYKRDIKDLEDPMLILKAQAREFKFVDNHCGCFEKDGKHFTADICELPEGKLCCRDGGQCDYTESGFIAEELEAIGLDRLVCYGIDEDGKKQCEGVRYERVAVYLLEVVKALHSRVEALEREIIV